MRKESNNKNKAEITTYEVEMTVLKVDKGLKDKTVNLETR